MTLFLFMRSYTWLSFSSWEVIPDSLFIHEKLYLTLFLFMRSYNWLSFYSWEVIPDFLSSYKKLYLTFFLFVRIYNWLLLQFLYRGVHTVAGHALFFSVCFQRVSSPAQQFSTNMLFKISLNPDPSKMYSLTQTHKN